MVALLWSLHVQIVFLHFVLTQIIATPAWHKLATGCRHPPGTLCCHHLGQLRMHRTIRAQHCKPLAATRAPNLLRLCIRQTALAFLLHVLLNEPALVQGQPLVCHFFHGIVHLNTKTLVQLPPLRCLRSTQGLVDSNKFPVCQSRWPHMVPAHGFLSRAAGHKFARKCAVPRSHQHSSASHVTSNSVQCGNQAAVRCHSVFAFESHCISSNCGLRRRNLD